MRPKKQRICLDCPTDSRAKCETCRAMAAPHMREYMRAYRATLRQMKAKQ